ncbi:hypothetical protein JOD54_002480 [Actinokineospora baliensis]|uniref:hypothetical protein n=1 Tax=Actinokineospora baliensis TaxID=547056 RepID=UPI00195DCF5B|nr:hypothetical protein [Actinokineospora baliensis]MBM7772276.1 hypothetical protein [Actinokineospora baliensis]
MRRDRFIEYLREQLAAAGHPGIASIDSYAVDPKVSDLRITCTDGRVISLHTTRTSPPGGDNFTEPERIVNK